MKNFIISMLLVGGLGAAYIFSFRANNKGKKVKIGKCSGCGTSGCSPDACGGCPVKNDINKSSEN